MTDIVERLLLKKTLETVEDVHVLFADAADEIEQLRERCTYFYEALHDIALGAHGNDGIEFARKAIGFVKLEFDADMIAAANDLINRAALGEAVCDCEDGFRPSYHMGTGEKAMLECHKCKQARAALGEKK